MECLPNYKKRLYAVWMTMKQRCLNPRNQKYKNCGWQHSEEIRKKLRKRFLTCGNETKSLSEWAKRTGISECSISARIDRRGWSVEKALTTPIRRHKIYGA